ncbi:sarcosine oxidase subunit delta [Elioraea sp.]|uniref:sarcosine oxidase subunit delta n=1 Tax=Elioraea sp. TaxID=2185103 RepID=UPI00307FA72D
MLRIDCPVCGLRDETEFTYGGDAAPVRPALDEIDPAPWVDYVFFRDDPCGPHREHWRHTLGCGLWLTVERDTLTNRVTRVALARPAEGAA